MTTKQEHAEQKEATKRWLHERIVQILLNSREPMTVSNLNEAVRKSDLPYLGSGIRRIKLERYVVWAVDELVQSGRVAKVVETISYSTYVKYRARSLLETLAWVAQDPEPQPTQSPGQSAPAG